MKALSSLHHSRVGKPPRPKDMARMQLPSELRSFIEDQALAIFTDMVNGGATLQQTVAAIYLSGMEAATAARRTECATKN